MTGACTIKILLSPEAHSLANMGNPLLKNESSSPYDQLHRPIRIAMTGLEASGKQTILASLASQDPTKPVIESESPTLGFTTHTLRSGPLRITAFDACPGYKQSLKLDTTTMRRNSDGVVFVIDCRDRARWVEAVEELKFLILNLEELRGAPLLVMANFVDAEVSSDVASVMTF